MPAYTFYRKPQLLNLFLKTTKKASLTWRLRVLQTNSFTELSLGVVSCARVWDWRDGWRVPGNGLMLLDTDKGVIQMAPCLCVQDKGSQTPGSQGGEEHLGGESCSWSPVLSHQRGAATHVCPLSPDNQWKVHTGGRAVC